jgi:hypothetical protein
MTLFLGLDAFETFWHDAGAGLGKGAIPMRGDTSRLPLALAALIGGLALFVVIASFVGTTREAHAVPSCPKGNQLALVIAPNGNALQVCPGYTGSGLDWYIYDSGDHLLNSVGGLHYTAVLNISVSPDSKFMIFLAVDTGGVDSYIYGSNGASLNNSGGYIYTGVLAVISTNDSKFAAALSWYTFLGGSGIDWYIYGTNGQYVNSAGAQNATLISLGGTSDSKVIVRICYTTTQQAEIYTYAANGTLESVTPGGPCYGSGASVGGIAELPPIASMGGSPGYNYAIAAVLALVAVVAFAAGGWYARRRWSR